MALNDLQPIFQHLYDFYLFLCETIINNRELTRAYKLSHRKTREQAQPVFQQIIRKIKSIPFEIRQQIGIQYSTVTKKARRGALREHIIAIYIKFGKMQEVKLFDVNYNLYLILKDLLVAHKQNLLHCYSISDFFDLLTILRTQAKRIFFEGHRQRLLGLYQLILAYFNNIDMVSHIDHYFPILYFLTHRDRYQYHHEFYAQHPRFREQNTSKFLQELEEISKESISRQIQTELRKKAIKETWEELETTIRVKITELQGFQHNNVFDQYQIFQKDLSWQTQIDTTISQKAIVRNLRARHSPADSFKTNHIIHRIDLMGLRLVLKELEQPFSIPYTIPEYVFGCERFDDLGVLFCFVDPSKYYNIRRTYYRINRLVLTRSLASYILKDRLSPRVVFNSLDFPALERVLRFKDAKNLLRKSLPKNRDKAQQFLDDLYNFAPRPEYLDVELFFDRKEKKFHIKRQQKHYLRPERQFVTNFPMNIPLINHDKGLVVYLRGFDDIAHIKSLIINYLRYWSDRCMILESDLALFVYAFFPLIEDYSQVIKYIKTVWEGSGIKGIFRHQFVDRNTMNYSKKGTQRHFFVKKFLPPRRLFSVEEGQFSIPFPTRSVLNSDFNLL